MTKSKVRAAGATDKSGLFLYYWNLLVPDEAWRPIQEYRFATPRKFRFDWAWPRHLIAVEVDGGNWAPGGGKHGSDRDREKLNIAASLGWRVFRVSPTALRRDPATFIDLVVTALRPEVAL